MATNVLPTLISSVADELWKDDKRHSGRIPRISSDKNKKTIKEIISKSPRTFGYLKNTS